MKILWAGELNATERVVVGISRVSHWCTFCKSGLNYVIRTFTKVNKRKSCSVFSNRVLFLMVKGRVVRYTDSKGRYHQYGGNKSSNVATDNNFLCRNYFQVH